MLAKALAAPQKDSSGVMQEFGQGMVPFVFGKDYDPSQAKDSIVNLSVYEKLQISNTIKKYEVDSIFEYL